MNERCTDPAQCDLRNLSNDSKAVLARRIYLVLAHVRDNRDETAQDLISQSFAFVLGIISRFITSSRHVEDRVNLSSKSPTAGDSS